MSRPDLAALLPLAESIADGSLIDWDAAEAKASDDERAVIRQLRVLSSLAGLHRSLPPETSDASVHTRTDASKARRATPPTGAPAIGVWAHLELVERLGGGTYGEVYRAWDRHLEREVALKLLKANETIDDIHASRIANEGRLLARVRHTNVITVHGVDAHDNRVGLWMDLVRGATLEQQLAAHGPFGAHEAALIGIDLCKALAAVHAAGLIHRDVKAQNVMREDGGRIVLMDLGTGRETVVTGRMAIPDLAGTPLYLAPEIFSGAAASERTDLYSLGVLLYHLVTNAFPVRATTIEQLRDGHCQGTGVRLRDARPDLPTAFVRVVERAIAADPARRYNSAGEFEAELLRTLDEAPVHAADAPPAVAPSRFSTTAGLIAAAAAAAILTIAAPAIYRTFGRAPVRLASRDTLLVADFVNNTHEPLFDDTLKEALTVELQQSPYLNAVGTRGVAVAVAAAGRAPNPAKVAAAARDLCKRQQMKAIVLGTIGSSGDGYDVSVRAEDCRTGETLAEGHGTAPSKTTVLRALTLATADLRGSLGESPASIQRFNVPAEAATTGSLDALKAYSVGMDTRARVGEAEAIPFFNHALELDPGFALAEANLAAIYSNLHELDQSAIHTKKAFELSEHVTERERLYIRASYHRHVTGRFDEALGAYRLWTEMYPQDWQPHHNIGDIYQRVGRFEEALKEIEKGRSLNPDHVIPYYAMAKTYVSLGRFREAREMIRTAQSRGLDAAASHQVLLQLALIEGGVEGMRKEFEPQNNGSTDYVIVATAARAEAFGGAFQAARNLVAQAVAKAKSGRMDDFASSLIAEDALNAAVTHETGYANRTVDRALAISRGSETLWAASLANAFTGRRKAAADQMTDYLKVTPRTTDVVAVFGPVLQAANDLAAERYERAIEALQPAAPYERIGRFWPAYLRGLAYLGLKRPREAAAQFDAILAHRGDDPTSVLFTLASLQKGRALREAGDVAAARAAYDEFVSAWRLAKRDQPTLSAALRERSRLPR